MAFLFCCWGLKTPAPDVNIGGRPGAKHGRDAQGHVPYKGPQPTAVRTVPFALFCKEGAAKRRVFLNSWTVRGSNGRQPAAPTGRAPVLGPFVGAAIILLSFLF